MKARGIRVTIKGTPGCQIVSGLSIATSDTVIIKKRYSAFFGTNLDETLSRLRPDGVILAGFNTHACSWNLLGSTREPPNRAPDHFVLLDL
jgi:nicotinamidase-related amidase